MDYCKSKVEGGINMKFILFFLLYFIPNFIFSKSLDQEIVKVTIFIKGNNYTSYVILSNKENPNTFFIVGEKL